MGKNSSTFDRNYILLMERFPAVAFEIPALPARERAKERVVPVVLDGVEALYFLGIGSGEGYSIARKWLRQGSSRRLIILEDDLNAVAEFLHRPLAKEVLSNPQVFISQPNDTEELAERFPFGCIEIAALPSKPESTDLKEDLLRKTTLSHALYLDRLHGHQPFLNFVRNLLHLPSSFYANKMKGRFTGVSAIVCGAGPSLKKAIPHLSVFENKALIIAGGSTISALSSQGILPHFGIVVDPNLEEYHRLKNSFAFEIPLIFSTRVCPAVFQTMNGPFGYMRSGIGGILELWIEEELGLSDHLLGMNLSSDSMSVTTMCLAWAQWLGCNPILLSGVDLAYTGGRRYAPGVLDGAEEDFDKAKRAGDRIVKRKSRLGQPVATAIRWLMESSAFSHFASMHPDTTFLNTTEGGIGFEKIPYCSLEDAAAQYFQKEMPLRTKVHEEICAAPMPEKSGEIIEQKMKELKESLDRIVVHLEVCAGNTPGSQALAEVEIQDEMAAPYLFYDAFRIVTRDLGSHLSSEEREKEKWKRFLILAKRYQTVLQAEFHSLST